jgi:hypothetical protein
MCLKILLYGGSLTKDYSFHNGVHNNLHIFFFQGFLFTYDLFTSLITTRYKNLLNANYEPEASIFTLYILKEKQRMNNQPHSFTSIPYVSNQSSHATYNFSSFYD